MKSFSKNTGLLLVLFTMLIIFSACGKGGGYREDVSVPDLSAAADAVIDGSENMDDPGESYISGIIKLTEDQYMEGAVKINVIGLNINEYGIFRGDSEEIAGEIEAAVQDYIQMRRDTWMSEYLPEEYPKLKDAEVKVYGNYVVYTILDSSEKEQVFSAVETKLKSE